MPSNVRAVLTHRINPSTTGSAIDGIGDLSQFVTIEAIAETNTRHVAMQLKGETGIDPQLYFTYLKKKFGMLEARRIEVILKRLEAAFNKAVKNGQISLGEKLLADLTVNMREAEMYAKGIKMFVEYADVWKHKKNIRGGHISDTKFEDYTRVVPDDVIAKKEKFEKLFDELWVFHYWNPKAEDVKEMDPDEKRKMRDPILFGRIKNSTRYYFIADWEDEFCDLTFDELVDVLGKDEKEVSLKHNIHLKTE